ncbi:disks large-associated protein 5 [Diretmus argenteus]
MESRFAHLRQRDNSVDMLRVKMFRRRSQSQKENRERTMNTRRQLDKLPELETSSVNASIMSAIQEKALNANLAKHGAPTERMKQLERWKERKALEKEKANRAKELKGVFKTGLYHQPKDKLSFVALPPLPGAAPKAKEVKMKIAQPGNIRVTRSMKQQPQVQKPQKEQDRNPAGKKVQPAVQRSTRSRVAVVQPLPSPTKTQTRAKVSSESAVRAQSTRSANRPTVAAAPLAKDKLKDKSAADTRATRTKPNLKLGAPPSGVERNCKVSVDDKVQPAVPKEPELMEPEQMEPCAEEQKMVEDKDPDSFAPQDFVFQPPVGLSTFKFEPLTPRSAGRFLSPSFSLAPVPVFGFEPQAELQGASPPKSSPPLSPTPAPPVPASPQEPQHDSLVVQPASTGSANRPPVAAVPLAEDELKDTSAAVSVDDKVQPAVPKEPELIEPEQMEPCAEENKMVEDKDPDSFAPQDCVPQAPVGLSTFKFEPLTPRSAGRFLSPSSKSPPGLSPTQAPPVPASPQEPQHDVPYFRSAITNETERLTALSQCWESRVEDESIPEEMRDRMRTVVGQARLLMKERFKQFSGLVDDCDLGRGEKITTCTDLQGFWDMVYYQVEDVTKKFDALKEAETRGWVEEHKPPPPRQRKVVKKPPPSTAAPKPTGAKSRLAAVKAAMKARQQAAEAEKAAAAAGNAGDGSDPRPQDTQPQAAAQPPDIVVFNGGFFKVESPAKLPGSLRKSSRLSPAVLPLASPCSSLTKYLTPGRVTRRSTAVSHTSCTPAQPPHTPAQPPHTPAQYLTPGRVTRRSTAVSHTPAQPPHTPAQYLTPGRVTRRSTAVSHTPAQPAHTPAQPAHTPAQPAHTPAQPAHTPAQPAHTPAQPAHTPAQPAHTPAQPAHTPAQPPHTPAQPPHTPAQPPHTPAQYLTPGRVTRRSTALSHTSCTPASPAQPTYTPAQPAYTPAQPAYTPAQPPASPAQAPASPAQAPASPAQAPASPAQAPASPAQAPASPAQAPASPAQPAHTPAQPAHPRARLTLTFGQSPCPGPKSHSSTPQPTQQAQESLSATLDTPGIEEIPGLDFERYLQPSERCSPSPGGTVAMETLSPMVEDTEMESPIAQPFMTPTGIVYTDQTAESCLLLFTPDPMDRIRQSVCPSDLMVFTPPSDM